MDRLFVPLGGGVPSGVYEACWDCAQLYEPGLRPKPPVPYPPPMNPAQFEDEMNYSHFFCGVCKTYCREDEELQCFRILGEDLKGFGALPLFDDGEIDPLPPGCYSACPECISKYKPAIWARLRMLCRRCGQKLDGTCCRTCNDPAAEPMIPADLPAMALNGDMLL